MGWPIEGSLGICICCFMAGRLRRARQSISID